MRPVYGEIVSLDNKNLIKVDEDNYTQFKYTGKTVVENGVRCATFTNDKGEVYMQPWQLATKFRVKGEKNVGASLTTDQVREMVRSFILDKVDVQTLGVKYNITPRHVQEIVSGKSWRHVTIGLIYQLRKGNKNLPVVASNKPKSKCKLSAVLIPFIRKDKENKMTVAQLAVKYCVSRRQIQRILAGKAWVGK